MALTIYGIRYGLKRKKKEVDDTLQSFDSHNQNSIEDITKDLPKDFTPANDSTICYHSIDHNSELIREISEYSDYLTQWIDTLGLIECAVLIPSILGATYGMLFETDMRPTKPTMYQNVSQQHVSYYNGASHPQGLQDITRSLLNNLTDDLVYVHPTTQIKALHQLQYIFDQYLKIDLLFVKKLLNTLLQMEKGDLLYKL